MADSLDNMTDKERTQTMKECVALVNQLEDEQTYYREHWKEIAEYMLPSYGRYLSSKSDRMRERGQKKGSKIISGLAKRCIRVFGAGVQNGLTSKSRKWFRLSTPNPAMNEIGGVREWLSLVRDIMLDVLGKSNFYDCAHTMYRELGAFGTACCIIEEDFDTVIRFRPLTIGEFYLANDAQGRTDILVRRFSMTSRQMIQEYGKDAVTQKIRDEEEKNAGETEHNIIQVIRPNAKHDKDKPGRDGHAYQSIHYQEGLGAAEAKFLRVAGYKSKPFAAPRWDPVSGAAYGDGLGMDALPDVKQLQVMSRDKLRALEKHVNPPMNAPSTLKSVGASIVAGGINYMPDGNGGTGNNWLTPAFQTSGDIAPVAAEIQMIHNDIRQTFYNDLFLAITNQNKAMTAHEVAERSAEKLAQIGPAVERVELEMLDICIDRTFEKCLEFGIIPPAPQELSETDLRVEYIGVLAQAQKMSDISAIEQLLAFAGNMAGVKPEALDKIDFDQALDEYHDRIGSPPRVVRSDKDVEQIRNQRAQLMQQQQQAQAVNESVAAAKTLSETDVGGESALQAVLGGML